MLLLFVATNVAIAEDSSAITEDGDYVEIEKGDKAPYAGYLFDHDSLAALIARREKEKEQILLDKDTEYKKLKLTLEAEVAKKQIELDINKDLAEKILAVNKEELKLTKNKLDKLSWISPALFVGGVITGSILTISILKIAVDIAK
jgi:hypothetical protein